MPARFHVPLPLLTGHTIDLPSAAARHVQVLRMQPGQRLNVFDGSGGEWSAEVVQMGRSSVSVRVGECCVALPEPACAVTLAIGMPTNERMDALVEKATELGVAVVQPLICERSVLRVQGERAERKVAHWQAVAVAASEQCGRATVPRIEPVCSLAEWLAGRDTEAGATEAASAVSAAGGWSGVLSLRGDAAPLAAAIPSGWALPPAAVFLSGPEGGLAADEEDRARETGFQPIGLGPRVLRADTAPLAALAWIALATGAPHDTLAR